jgi:hypothetical protein
MKILKTFGAPCHVCNGTGIIECCMGDHECGICDGTGVSKITSESDPILLEVFSIPSNINEPQKRDSFFVDERNATYLSNIVDENLRKERLEFSFSGQQALFRDLKRLEDMCSNDTNLFLHVSRISDLAKSGFYHLKRDPGKKRKRGI